jgi:hypothetical protein
MIMTDESWTAGPSAVWSNDLYDGEDDRCGLQSDAWLQPDFSKKDWTGVHPGKIDFATLTPYIGPPFAAKKNCDRSRSGPHLPVRPWSILDRTWWVG